MKINIQKHWSDYALDFVLIGIVIAIFTFGISYGSLFSGQLFSTQNLQGASILKVNLQGMDFNSSSEGVAQQEEDISESPALDSLDREVKNSTFSRADGDDAGNEDTVSSSGRRYIMDLIHFSRVGEMFSSVGSLFSFSRMMNDSWMNDSWMNDSWGNNSGMNYNGMKDKGRNYIDRYRSGANNDRRDASLSNISLTNNISGREVMYPFMEEGDMLVARQMLDGFDGVSPRFTPYHIENITWKENPYNEKYWRFVFYSLRPLNNLLYAWNETGDEVYLIKLKSLLKSYLQSGTESDYAWDPHTAAFRTMVLINIWGKLDAKDQLTPELRKELIVELQKSGDFLAEEDHYESLNNHAVTEAAALYLLAETFPNLIGATHWKELAQNRFLSQFNDLIDSDGVLIENSPYYHFYVLQFYVNIYNYSARFHLPIEEPLLETITKMTTYGTYIITPSRHIPSLGASIDSVVSQQAEYKELADLDSSFQYVLSEGQEGKMLLAKSVFFPIAGQSILRSGWGEERPFEKETFLYFDSGPYRSAHSHLDALSFYLFGEGRPLLIDSGLFTFEEGIEYTYFHGTSAHNTIVVDGLDQREGTGYARTLQMGDNYSYQSAYHSLYSGVLHERAVMLINSDVIIIIDRLKSDGELQSERNHIYSQTFHAAPDIFVRPTVKGADFFNLASNTLLFSIIQLGNQSYSFSQVQAGNIPYQGWCSLKYEIATACEQVAFEMEGKYAFFATAILLNKSRSIEPVVINDTIISFVMHDRSDSTANIDQDENHEVQVTQDVQVTISNPFTEDEKVSLIPSQGRNFLRGALQ